MREFCHRGKRRKVAYFRAHDLAEPPSVVTVPRGISCVVPAVVSIIGETP